MVAMQSESDCGEHHYQPSANFDAGVELCIHLPLFGAIGHVYGILIYGSRDCKLKL